MIRLFLSDVDGCLAVPYEPWDLVRLADLEQLGRSPMAPRLGICTGRPYSYAEAVAQALHVRGPVLFESGAGWFDLATATVRWHPALTNAVQEDLAEVRSFFERTLVPAHPALSIDYGKRAQVGCVAPTTALIEAALPQVEAYVAEHFPSFHVFHTEVSIDVVPPGLTKADAMRWVAEEEALPLDMLAFIGDTVGDLDALRTVGHSFAPANAVPKVRNDVQHALSGPVLEGTLEAFRWCISYNASSSAPMAG